MPKVKAPTSEPVKRTRPAMTDEAMENKLIALAYNEVERRILDHTATSQEIVHFLKLGSSKERIEKEILERQKDMIEAKTELMRAAKNTEELYENAIRAMQIYGGDGEAPADEDV